jgi:uncharacterized membrane protein YsdA (DUF1294 family)
MWDLIFAFEPAFFYLKKEKLDMERILLLWIYFIIVNIFAMAAMKIDKKRAKNKQYRISEKTLWMLALLGGGTGAYIGMVAFRHKTKHLNFRIGFLILMILQLALFGYWSM